MKRAVPDHLLYTAGLLADRAAAKTAHGLLRFCPEHVKAIVDPVCAGSRLAAVVPSLPPVDVPIVATVAEGGGPGDTVVTGFAPSGGLLEPEQRRVLVDAATRGYRVLHGLHDLLPAGPNVVNLRAFDPTDRVLPTGRGLPATRVLTVGTSGNVGKMTATIMLADALRRRGLAADWVATGQTGLLIRGAGRVIDSIPIDFVPGVIERLVVEQGESSDILVVEGQGGLLNPAWAPSTFALVSTVRPHYYVVAHRLGLRKLPGFDRPMPTVPETVAAHERLHQALGVPARLLGFTLDSSDVAPDDYERARRRLERELGVPGCDPVREGVTPIVEQFLQRWDPPAQKAGTVAEGQ